MALDEAGLTRLFKPQNDELLISLFLIKNDDWHILHDMTARDDRGPILYGHEYLLLNPDRGAVILNIMPNRKTDPDATSRLPDWLDKTASLPSAGITDLRILAVHHTDIEALPRLLEEACGAIRRPSPGLDKAWLASLKGVLQAGELERTRIEPTAPSAEPAGTAPAGMSRSRRFGLAASVLLLVLLVGLALPRVLMPGADQDRLQGESPAAEGIAAVAAQTAIPIAAPPSVVRPPAPERAETPRVPAAAESIPPIPPPPFLPAQPVFQAMPGGPGLPAADDATPSTPRQAAGAAVVARSITTPGVARPGMARAGSDARCRDLLIRAQLGEVEARSLEILRRGC